MNRRLVLTVLLLLVAPLLSTLPLHSAVATPVTALPVVAKEWVPPKPPQRYNPPAGVKLNAPLGTIEEQQTIRRHLNRTIDSTPAGARIGVLSWNIRDDVFVDKLIAAHKRKVTVRVLVAKGNWKDDNPNPLMDQLDKVLRTKGKRWSNDRRPKVERSKVKGCRSSCRGSRGIAHAKYYLFSHVGPKLERPLATGVVMQGSANATIVATNRQWNDLHTIKDRPEVYRYFNRIFEESERDKPVEPPFSRKVFDGFTAEFLPWGGRTDDPTLRQLNRINCLGAKGDASVGGRTHIRIAQTAFLDERGELIARRLKTMWDRGCDVKIVYALMGKKILRIMREPTGNGPVPIQQITQDWDADGVYDRYLHTKFMTVSGVYAGNPAAEVSINGSTNWTAKAMRSDETIGIVYDAAIRRQYADWVDQRFANPPPGAAPAGRMIASRIAPGAEIPGPDRYRGIEP